MLSWQEVGLFDRRNQPTVEAAGFEPATTHDKNTTVPEHNPSKNHTPQTLTQAVNDTSRTLPEHFPNTFLQQKFATYVQQQKLPPIVRAVILDWDRLPDEAKSAIQEVCESQLDETP
jgi:hypothetical protein